MSEKRMWNYLQPKLTQYAQCQRISDTVARGVPDVVVALRADGLGRTGFIELKYAEVAGRKLGVRPEQAIWLARWPGPCGLLVRVESVRWVWIRPADTIDWIELAKSKNWELLTTAALDTSISNRELGAWVLNQLFSE